MTHQNFLSLALSPHGKLCLDTSDSKENLLDPQASERIRKAFELSSGHGLLHLGIHELNTSLPFTLAYWRDFGRLFLTQLCAIPGLAEQEQEKSVLQVPLPSEELSRFAASAPPMMGAEYLSAERLNLLWTQTEEALRQEASAFKGGIKAYLEKKNSLWNLVGYVYFNLAENKADMETPFAFLATYTHRISEQGRVQHLPLGQALKEFAGTKNKHQLLALLAPIQKASAQTPFLKAMVDSGEIFHPLGWTPSDAYKFLKDIPFFEASGIVVRVPDWWKTRRPPRPQVSVTIGDKEASAFGLDSLLDFSVRLTLDGENLTENELKQILSATEGLSLIRGKWVEIDQYKLKEVLSHWKAIERASSEDGFSFVQGMRLLAGAAIGDDGESITQATVADWSSVSAGDWLANILKKLKNPDGSLKSQADPGSDLKTTLRPYQKIGVEWLWMANRLGLGVCLADDMGLGKTIQVLALLLLLKREGKRNGKAKPPNLLVAPASLMGNWKAEIERFAPGLKLWIAHSSALEGRSGAQDMMKQAPENLAKADLVITTYASVYRLPWICETQWGVVALDEAQAIKNPQAKQACAVKALKSGHRLALTGTPVENHLSDLWSLFDYLCPGLLGGAKDFERFVKTAAQSDGHAPYGALRNLVRPYILRRLKSDKSVISDLPDKTEVRAFCQLTKVQAALYQQAVHDLSRQINEVEGIKRRGVILAFLIRFKQICNHPSQWLRDSLYKSSDSGKFLRLRELCEVVASKQEKVLIFTQFREIIEPLDQFLSGVFGKRGSILHGGTAIRKRKEMVEAFQDDKGPPYFLLSLKAGGTGLNLTAASHVIHFDRWWNPAVENQATDRAYRIGQKRNILVHKFVCRGTIEEKIDKLIESKLSLSREILEGSGEALLTELPNEELLKLVSLDLDSALEET